MNLLARKCEGGPLDGQTLNLIPEVKHYKAQQFAYELGELVLQYHKYTLNENGVFIYKGKA